MGGILHTPYDGSAVPFTIGLSQLDENDWIEVDDLFADYHREKLNLYKNMRHKVIVSDEGTVAAQQEVLDVLGAFLPRRFPQIYAVNGMSMQIAGLADVALADSTMPPLAAAALLVQEDLCLMRKSVAGWRLSAASVCFPSAWDLLDKFKKPMGEIHGAVPGFATGSRNASLIERMFDNLSPERMVIRWNWSLNDTPALYLPLSKHGVKRRFGEGQNIADKVFIRLERQTFRKMPKSGDVLFTIRTHVNPLEDLEQRPDAATLAASLEKLLLNMNPDELRYKSLEQERARLVSRLRLISAR
jgi:dimethylamine monooxygenase subunit A